MTGRSAVSSTQIRKMSRLAIRITCLLLVIGLWKTGRAEDHIEIDKLRPVLQSYAEAIGCDFSFDAKNVVKFQIDSDGGTQYVAAFYLDPGCSGGSGMGSSMLAVMSQDSTGSFHVRADLSQPALMIGFPRFIDRIYVRGNAIWISAKEYDFTKDALCCPSVAVHGRITTHNKSLHLANKDVSLKYFSFEK